jgi:hypothetical protein
MCLKGKYYYSTLIFYKIIVSSIIRLKTNRLIGFNGNNIHPSLIFEYEYVSLHSKWNLFGVGF